MALARDHSDIDVKLFVETINYEGHFFFHHGNNSRKHDTVASHGACNECSMNVDALGMSIATLKCLAFQICLTLYAQLALHISLLL